MKNLYNSSITVLDKVLNLTYVENTGGAFGIGNDGTMMFIVVTLIVMAIIIKFILSKKDEISTSILIALGLILAGGIGNLVDRIFRGFVVDYIDFNSLIKYPIFNLSDICIVLGCIIIGINLIIEVIKSRNKKV